MASLVILLFEDQRRAGDGRVETVRWTAGRGGEEERLIKECSSQVMRKARGRMHHDQSGLSKYNHRVGVCSGSHAMEVESAEAVHQRARQCQLIGRRT